MDIACQTAKRHGVRRCVPLAVSCPFHSTLLRPAEDAMRIALDSAHFQTPHTPLVSNVTAQEVCI